MSQRSRAYDVRVVQEKMALSVSAPRWSWGRFPPLRYQNTRLFSYIHGALVASKRVFVIDHLSDRCPNGNTYAPESGRWMEEEPERESWCWSQSNYGTPCGSQSRTKGEGEWTYVVWSKRDFRDDPKRASVTRVEARPTNMTSGFRA